MQEDWILLHFDSTFYHWSVAERKEHIISLKNKEINLQSTAKGKKHKSADRWKSGIPALFVQIFINDLNQSVCVLNYLTKNSWNPYALAINLWIFSFSNILGRFYRTLNLLNSSLIFCLKWTFLIYLQSTQCFKQASTSSAHIPLVTTGKIYLKICHK